MSPRHEVTTSQKLEILRLLAIDDYTLRATADETDLPYKTVADVAEAFGYPEPDKMLAAIDRLQDHADTPEHHTPAPRPVPTPPPAAAKVTGPRADLDAATADTGPNPHAKALDAAKISPKARTRALGEKITTLLAQLEQILEQEAAAAKNAARIAALKAELAALEGKTAAPAAGTVDSKAIRAWAAEQGIECAANGRVPTTVREAYDAAHQDDAA